MLAVGQRLRRRTEFTAAVRSGRRAGRGALVVHLLPPSAGSPVSPASTARAGFVVPRAVGPAVVRNKVRRRLRHLVRAHLARLEPGTGVVVRALPGSAQRSFAELGADLERAIAAASAPRRAHAGTERGRRRPAAGERP